MSISKKMAIQVLLHKVLCGHFEVFLRGSDCLLQKFWWLSVLAGLLVGVGNPDQLGF
jgi:hypothetical protein